jgi:hypothetical protein
MSRKAATEKAEKEAASAAMDAIEAAARKQYEADTAAAAAAMGSWSWTAESGYYYNAVHRCAGMGCLITIHQHNSPGLSRAVMTPVAQYRGPH